jgi:hypothetical protein
MAITTLDYETSPTVPPAAQISACTGVPLLYAGIHHGCCTDRKTGLLPLSSKTTASEAAFTASEAAFTTTFTASEAAFAATFTTATELLRIMAYEFIARGRHFARPEITKMQSAEIFFKITHFYNPPQKLFLLGTMAITTLDYEMSPTVRNDSSYLIS